MLTRRSLALLLFACLAHPLLAVSGGQVLVSKLPRADAAVVPGDDLKALVAGNTESALALYHQRPAGQNVVFSPYGIQLVMAML